jgi:hypothetical protein
MWAGSVLKVSCPTDLRELLILTQCTDNILITKDGYENLTTAVKDVAEMEKLINGS